MDKNKYKKWEDGVESKATKIWNNHKILVFICLLVGPFIVQLVFNIINICAAIYELPFKFPSPDSWIGFWGSYLGIIPSGLIAWIVASKQIESSRENDKRNYGKI